MRFVDEEGAEKDVSAKDLASMDLDTARVYLDTVAHAIYPDGQGGNGPYILRLELENFIERVIRFTAQMDRLRQGGMSAQDLIRSEPFLHDLPFLKEQGEYAADIAKRSGVETFDFRSGETGQLGQFIVDGACAILSSRIEMGGAVMQIGQAHRELLADQRTKPTETVAPIRALALRAPINHLGAPANDQ